MSNHTPGPWLAEPSVRGFEITANDVRIGEARNEANARLIAAAPETKRQRDELLSAMREVDRFFHQNDDFTDDGEFPVPEFIVAAREAINSATKEEE